MTRMGPLPARVKVFIHEFVTGGGMADTEWPASWAAEGGAMRRALANDFAALPGFEVVVTRDRRLPPDHAAWHAVAVGPGEELQTLQHHAAEADYTLIVAPETDAILQTRAMAVEQAGGRSLGSVPEAIVIAGDKWRTEQQLRACGIPTTVSRLVKPAEGLPGDIQFPAVFKPIDGAGALHTCLVASQACLARAASELQTAIVQPFVPGTAMSASFLLDQRGTPWLVAVGRQRIVRQDGSFHYRGGTLPVPRPAGFNVVEQAASSIPGLRGFVGIDFVCDASSGELTVLEINPRATTSCVGLRSVLPPGELAAAWIAAVEGQSEPILAQLASRVEQHRPVCFDSTGRVRRSVDTLRDATRLRPRAKSSREKRP
jgi:predicted ATP-grasp superfamily ATP-dependent carboligase